MIKMMKKNEKKKTYSSLLKPEDSSAFSLKVAPSIPALVFETSTFLGDVIVCSAGWAKGRTESPKLPSSFRCNT